MVNTHVAFMLKFLCSVQRVALLWAPKLAGDQSLGFEVLGLGRSVWNLRLGFRAPSLGAVV